MSRQAAKKIYVVLFIFISVLLGIWWTNSRQVRAR